MKSQGDVRMRGFVERIHVPEALAALRPLVAAMPAEAVPLDAALGRTLAEEVVSAVEVPAFAKSAMDGYGLRAAETFGATAESPLAFRLVGEILPGRELGRSVGPGEAVRIMTGGPVPDGVDAVVMAEKTEQRGAAVMVSEPLPPGKNVAPIAEDIARGDRVLARGRRLRPQDLGVLASIGRAEAVVHRRPRVMVATTGNELVAPEELSSAPPTAVVNSNGFVIEALVREHGGEPIRHPIVADDRAAVQSLMAGFDGDVLVTTGGTAVGQEDFLPVVLAELGEVVVHGINIRPGGPVGFGRIGERLVFLLPGNPVAAVVGFDVLVRPCLQWMLGQEEGRRNARSRGRLTRKIASGLNRVDFVRVRYDVSGGVEPVRAGGAGVLTSITKADGFVMIGKDLEGLEAGTEVEVYLW